MPVCERKHFARQSCGSPYVNRLFESNKRIINRLTVQDRPTSVSDEKFAIERQHSTSKFYNSMTTPSRVCGIYAKKSNQILWTNKRDCHGPSVCERDFESYQQPGASQHSSSAELSGSLPVFSAFQQPLCEQPCAMARSRVDARNFSSLGSDI